MNSYVKAKEQTREEEEARVTFDTLSEDFVALLC